MSDILPEAPLGSPAAFTPVGHQGPAAHTWTAWVKYRAALVIIRSMIPHGRHATPDECRQIDEVAVAALLERELPGGDATAAPGQAAYEAHAATFSGNRDAYDQLPRSYREAWEAAAQAAVDASDSTALAQLAMAQEAISDLAAGRDEARARLARAEQEHDEIVGIYGQVTAERDQLRELLAEILASYERHTTYYASKPHQGTFAQWRQRAGLGEP